MGHATVTVAGKRQPASKLSCTLRRDGVPPPTTEYGTRLWLDKSTNEDMWPFKLRVSGQQVWHNALRMDGDNGGGALIGNNPDTRTRRHWLASPSSTTASAPSLRTLHARLEITWPTQSSGRKPSIGTYSTLATLSFLSLC